MAADSVNRTQFLGHEDFSPNSLLGEFDVQLTGARPASVVYVEFGQNYIIGAKRDGTNHAQCVMWTHGSVTFLLTLRRLKERLRSRRLHCLS